MNVDRQKCMNREAYNRIAADWDAARRDFYGREREYLDAFLAGLPVPSPILDLGCGTGRPFAEYVLARGHRLTGVDQAENLLAIARTRLSQATWIAAAIEEFRSAERFAGIICWDALFHIERTRHAALLARMTALLLPGGRLMLTVGGSEHPAFIDRIFGAEFFYDSHPPETALTLLRDLGFEAPISEFMNLPTKEREKGRFAIVARLAE